MLDKFSNVLWQNALAYYSELSFVALASRGPKFLFRMEKIQEKRWI